MLHVPYPKKLNFYKKEKRDTMFLLKDHLSKYKSREQNNDKSSYQKSYKRRDETLKMFYEMSTKTFKIFTSVVDFF